MVQATFLVAAFAAALAGTAMADGCKPGTIYCGVTFIKDGYLLKKMSVALGRAGLPTTSILVENSLFACGDDDSLVYIGHCGMRCSEGAGGANAKCVKT